MLSRYLISLLLFFPCTNYCVRLISYFCTFSSHQARRDGHGEIRQGSIVQLAPGHSSGCLLSETARGRVIATDESDQPFLVRSLEGMERTHWYRSNEVVLADVASTAVRFVADLINDTAANAGKVLQTGEKSTNASIQYSCSYVLVLFYADFHSK